MQLFYSNPLINNEPSDPQKSLGGYVSSSVVPNGRLNNLFATIDKSSIANNDSETKLIVLKNTMAAAANSIRIWTQKGELFNFKIGAILPAIDDCQRSVFETIQQSSDIPYQSVLIEKEGESNALNVGSLDPQGCIGIWIMRTLDLTKFNAGDGYDSLNQNCEQLAQTLTSVNQIQEDNSQLIIDWV